VFERFSQEAREVVVGAQDEARDLRHEHVGVEHMLLGVLRLPPEQVTSQVLASLGVEGDEIRERLRELGAPGQLVAGQLPFTPRAKRVLELSVREALSRGDTQVGPDHILLAIVRDDDGLAVQLLKERGVTLEHVRDAVVAALPPPEPALATRSFLRRARRSTVHQLPMEVDLSDECRRLLMSAGARALDDGRILIEIADIEEALRRHHDAEDPPPQSATG
jgi:ATP-dependent Clp protease ATP-binding subunit ClpA